MVKLLTPQEIAAKKKLIRQGLYWEALDLSRDYNMKDVVLHIAELRRSADSDQEFSTMLIQVKNDFATGNYPKARELCDDFFSRLSSGFSCPVVEEDVTSREHIWGNNIQPNLHNFASTSHSVRRNIAVIMRRTGVQLVNRSQEELASNKIDCSTAIRAVKKGIQALQVAQTYIDAGEIEYPPEKKDIDDLLTEAEKIQDSLSRGQTEGVFRSEKWRLRRLTEAQRRVNEAVDEILVTKELYSRGSVSVGDTVGRVTNAIREMEDTLHQIDYDMIPRGKGIQGLIGVWRDRRAIARERRRVKTLMDRGYKVIADLRN